MHISIDANSVWSRTALTKTDLGSTPRNAYISIDTYPVWNRTAFMKTVIREGEKFNRFYWFKLKHRAV